MNGETLIRDVTRPETSEMLAEIEEEQLAALRVLRDSWPVVTWLRERIVSQEGPLPQSRPPTPATKAFVEMG